VTLLNRFFAAVDRRIRLQLYKFRLKRIGVKDVWGELLPPITLIDIGGSYYTPRTWTIPLSVPVVKIISIDPNAENLEFLEDSPFRAQKVVAPFAVSGTGGRRKLFKTNVDSGSSLFKPRPLKPLEEKIFNDIKSYFFPIKELYVETITLNDILRNKNVTEPIFLKLDIQGAELEVLQSIESILKSGQVIAIETEASLMSDPLMQNGANFAEISEYLAKLDFELVNLVPIFSPINTEGNLNFGRGFLNECDAFFVKSYNGEIKLSLDAKIALFVAYVMYGFSNHALALAESDTELMSLIEYRIGYNKLSSFLRLINKYDQNVVK
jgi:FkbM family methyltransferase